jgi:ribonuclease-3
MPDEDEPPSPLPEETVRRLEAAIGHQFRDPALLAAALSPLDPERRDAALARQRLRFLGDALWNFALASAAVGLWPHASAGELTRVRAVWSRSSGLARLARQAGIAGLEPDESERVLGERMEAVLGAVLADDGLPAVQAFAQRLLGAASTHADAGVDPKSALQMLAQARFGHLPAYRLLERRGPSHRPIFRVGVSLRGLDGEVRAEAEGPSRQAAEQEAARRMLEQLQQPVHNIS